MLCSFASLDASKGGSPTLDTPSLSNTIILVVLSRVFSVSDLVAIKIPSPIAVAPPGNKPSIPSFNFFGDSFNPTTISALGICGSYSPP